MEGTKDVVALTEGFLELLACPTCRGELGQDAGYLVCGRCRVRYPIREGVPVLLAHEAEAVP